MRKKNQIGNIPDFEQIANQLKKDVRTYAKVFCLQWFDDSFHKQGFTDAGFQPWEKRKEPDRRKDGAILVDTTFLRKSLSILSEGQTTIEFGTTVPYAQVHNDGLRIRRIAYVRPHNRKRNGKRYQVKGFSRRMDTKFQKRQFIGESKLMLKGLDTWVHSEIIKRFSKK